MNFLKGLADKAKSAADALESPTKLGQGIINQPSFQGGSARYILRKRFLDPPTPPLLSIVYIDLTESVLT